MKNVCAHARLHGCRAGVFRGSQRWIQGVFGCIRMPLGVFRPGVIELHSVFVCKMRIECGWNCSNIKLERGRGVVPFSLL